MPSIHIINLRCQILIYLLDSSYSYNPDEGCDKAKLVDYCQYIISNKTTSQQPTSLSLVYLQPTSSYIYIYIYIYIYYMYYINNLFIHPSIYLSTYLSVYLSTSLSIYLYIYLYLYISLSLSISIYLSIYLSLYIYIYRYIHISIYIYHIYI